MATVVPQNWVKNAMPERPYDKLAAWLFAAVFCCP